MAKCFSVVLVVFAVSAANVPDSSNNVVDLGKILKKMKSLESKVAEVEMLKRKVATLENGKASKRIADMQLQKSDTADIETLKRRVAAIEKEKSTRNGICRIKNNPCGDGCICVENYLLVSKYFCDCRSQITRRDCKEHYQQGARINGLYTINNNINGHNLQVFCDQTTDGGGWTVIQRRVDGSENFYRNWTEYKLGFGQLHREHWLGNENIFHLTSQAFLRGSQVRFDMLVKGGSTMKWAKYSSFSISNEVSGYRLHVSGHSGTITGGYKFTYQDGMKFTTYDRDNDVHDSLQCAVYCHGGFWYRDCNHVNPNGRFEKEGNIEQVFRWYPHRLTFIEMKVRRK